MKAAIRYYSKFGHSKQMAQAIAEIAKAEPLTVEKPLNENFDILFLRRMAYSYYKQEIPGLVEGMEFPQD